MVISEVLVLIYGRRISLPSRSYDDITSSQCSGCGFCIFFTTTEQGSHISSWNFRAMAQIRRLAAPCSEDWGKVWCSRHHLFFLYFILWSPYSDVLLWCLGDDNSDGNQTSPGRRNRTCFHDNGMYIISDGTTTQILCKFLYIIFTELNRSHNVSNGTDSRAPKNLFAFLSCLVDDQPG